MGWKEMTDDDFELIAKKADILDELMESNDILQTLNHSYISKRIRNEIKKRLEA